MPRREGSGRKPGSKNIKTRAIADQAAAAGITPLEVMIEAMRHFRETGNLSEATRVAKDAAPYMHPRLASFEHATKDGRPVVDNSIIVYGGVLVKGETV